MDTMDILESDEFIKLYDQGIRPTDCNNDIFIEICKQGRLDIAEQIYEEYDINISARNNFAFQTSCIKGHIEIAKWLYYKIKEKNTLIFPTIIKCIQYKKIEMVKWLYMLDQTISNKEHEYYFKKACIYDNLELVQWIYKIKSIDTLDNETITSLCQRNKLKILEWLNSIPNLVFSIYCHTSLFRSICTHGYLELAQWFYSQYKNNIDIHCNNDTIFTCAGYSNNFDLILWLYNEVYEGKISIFCQNDIFNKVCTNNNLKLAQWIYTTFITTIDIRAYNDLTFKYVCSHKQNIEIAKWLCTLCEDYTIQIVDNIIIEYKIISIKERLINMIKNNEIDEYYKNAEICDEDDMCPICLDQCEKWIKLKCNHQICLDCYVLDTTKECAYGCKGDINNFTKTKIHI